MKYTVRYAHLETTSLKAGDKIKTGEVVGIMGNTGQSTGAHLHIDCVFGRQSKKYTLADIERGDYESCPRQLNHFIDAELFGCKPIITTYYAEPEYMRTFKKLHLGYDVIPSGSAHRVIKWNRSMSGSVSAILNDPAGYGNCVYITFEA